MAETVYVPDNNSGNTVPAWLAMGNGWNNGGLFGGMGGSAFWGALLGSIVPGIFGGWGNGFNGMGGNGAAAASLGAQATANSNAALLQQAIQGTDADIRLLATTLNTDVDSLKLGINTVQGAIAQVGAQLGMTGLQVINAVQAGDASVISKLTECCCNMKQLVTEQGYQNQLATLNQTNALSGAITGGNQRVVDAIADLKTTTISEFCAARERDMQAKIDTQAEIITQLRNQADNANQTAQFAAMLAPINAKLVEIESKQPNTVPVTWPQLTAVNTTPYVNGGFYGNSFGFGNGVSF